MPSLSLFLRRTAAPLILLTLSAAAGAGVVAPPWPGAGAGQPNSATGYPPVSFWKEEGVVGNNWLNVMIDQNGTIYDIHYPGAGGVNGVGTRNEGYNGRFDTFPPLPSGRGQRHANQYMTGIRVNGTTHWYSNPNAVSYSQIRQSYHPTSQTITTTRRLQSGSTNLFITQHDFAPKLEGGPIAYPTFPDGGLLATALHVDADKGGIIAGFHNGAYPYCWPRDAVNAAVTFARTGHFTESAGVYAWLAGC